MENNLGLLLWTIGKEMDLFVLPAATHTGDSIRVFSHGCCPNPSEAENKLPYFLCY